MVKKAIIDIQATTNKTIINKTVKLVYNGFVIAVLINERICFYTISEFTKSNKDEITALINNFI